MQIRRKQIRIALLAVGLALLLAGCPAPLPWHIFFYYQPQGVCPNGVEITVHSAYPETICKWRDFQVYDCYPPYGQGETENWSYVFRQKGPYVLSGPKIGEGYSFQANWTLTCLGSNRPPLAYRGTIKDPIHPSGPTTVYILEKEEAPSGIEISVAHGMPPEDP